MFEAFCVSGDVPIKFEANLKLFDGVIKLRSHWGIVSAGKLQATLRKVSEDWDTLLSPSMEVPKNLQRWFEMEEDKEEEIDQPEEEEEIKIKPKKKKRGHLEFNPIVG